MSRLAGLVFFREGGIANPPHGDWQSPLPGGDCGARNASSLGCACGGRAAGTMSAVVSTVGHAKVEALAKDEGEADRPALNPTAASCLLGHWVLGHWVEATPRHDCDSVTQ